MSSDEEVSSVESDDDTVANVMQQSEPRGFKKRQGVSVYNGFGDDGEGEEAASPALAAVQPDPESDDDEEEGGKRMTIEFEKPDGPIGLKAGPASLEARMEGGASYPRILKLITGSAAGKELQMQVGDKIVSVNGEDMEDCDPSDVHAVVRDTEPGDDLTFVIEAVGPRTRLDEDHEITDDEEVPEGAVSEMTLAGTHKESAKLQVVVEFTKPMKRLGLIAGVRKDATDDDYPIVDNLVEDSFAHSFAENGLAIGNSIVSVNGKNCKGMVGSDVHALVKAIEPGAGVRIKLMPSSARIKQMKRRSDVPSQSMRGMSSMTSLDGAAPGRVKRPSMELAGFEGLDDLETDLFET